MKFSRTKLLIYIAFLGFFFTLLVFDLVVFNNLKNTLQQTEGEKIVLQMMLHLDKFQLSLTEIESQEKPFLLYHYPEKVNKITKAWTKADTELNSLKDLRNFSNIPITQILTLDSLYQLRKRYSQQFVLLSQEGKFDNVNKLLNNNGFNISWDLLNTQYKTVSDIGRAALKSYHDNQDQKSIRTIRSFGIISAVIFLFMGFILWRLIRQTNQKDKLLTEKESLSASLTSLNKSLETRVHEQTDLLNAVFERVKDGVIGTDQQFLINYANDSVEILLGLNSDTIIGKQLFETLSGIIGEINNTLIATCIKTQEKISFEFWHEHKSKWFNVICYPSANGISLYLKDITENKLADLELGKSKRLYEFISKANDIILYATEAEQMFSEVCKIAVHTGNFLFSWIGLHDSEKHIIKPVAWAGHEEGAKSFTNTITTLDEPKGRGPSGKAIREGIYVYSNDIENDPAMLPWKDECLKRGYRSIIAVPIKLKSIVVAVFVLTSSKVFYFTEDEIQLLERVAENISYALTNLEINRKRKEAEKQLQKVSLAVEQSFSIICITDIAGNIEYVNDAFTEQTGYSYEEVMGKNPRIMQSGFTDPSVYLDLWNKLNNNQVWRGEFCNRKKNGEIYWEHAVISPIRNEEGFITNYIGVKENITEKKKLESEQKELIKIIENTTAFVATVDMEGNFLYANSSVREALGVSAENISLLNIEEFRSVQGLVIKPLMYTSLLNSGKWVGENSYITKNGIELPLLQVAILHRDENDNPTHISTTAIDLTRVKAIEKETERLNKELRDLSNHLLNLSEIEKKDIAREIHDELGQGLTGLKLNAAWIKRHIGEDRKILEEKIEELMEEINSIMSSFRRIYVSLHPSMLDELGLYGSIQWLINTFNKSSGILIHLASNIEHENIKFTRTLALYRVIQESLTNIMRHAGATEVTINLFKQDNRLRLEIKDNGSGFDELKVDTQLHHGLLGMRERIMALNGSFVIKSVIGEGTSITASISFE